MRAGRVNSLVISTITVAGLAHALQKERAVSSDAPRRGLADSLRSSARLADNR
jgi:hypothetical protein